MVVEHFYIQVRGFADDLNILECSMAHTERSDQALDQAASRIVVYFFLEIRIRIVL